MTAKNKKRSIGRQKIELKKIANEGSRQVCFSKRRAGLFKKANELSILCGAELAILVFSPGGKPYSFSHPSLDLISNRLLTGEHHHQPSSSTAIITSTDRSMLDLRSTDQNLNTTDILNRRHESSMESLEKERRRKAELDDVLRSAWFSDENLDKSDLGQLDIIQKRLASIKEQVHKALTDSYKSFYEKQQHHHYRHAVESMVELPKGVAGSYDQEHDSFMVPFNVMNRSDVPNCFPLPPVHYDHRGPYQFFG